MEGNDGKGRLWRPKEVKKDGVKKQNNNNKLTSSQEKRSRKEDRGQYLILSVALTHFANRQTKHKLRKTPRMCLSYKSMSVELQLRCMCYSIERWLSS